MTAFFSFLASLGQEQSLININCFGDCTLTTLKFTNVCISCSFSNPLEARALKTLTVC